MGKAPRQKTTADYVAIAISPALIMVLVGSFVFFLLEVFYGGQHATRLHWILFWFVFASVLISRISIEHGSERAGLYGLALAAATGIAVVRLVDTVLGCWALLALIWWCANKLTWDCTLIDDKEDASGEGLLQVAGFDEEDSGASGGGPRLEATRANQLVGDDGSFGSGTTLDPWWQRLFLNRPERNGQPHAPGLWVIYFSMAALPTFGIGQLLLDSSQRSFGFKLLWVYVAAALGLLVTTSFLGLRRYLRQRRLQMPDSVTTSWLGMGAAFVGLVLIVCILLPRPDADYSATAIASKLVGSVARDASRLATVRGGSGEGEGRRIGEAKPGAETNQSAPGKGGKPSPDGAPSQNGKAGGQASGMGQSSSGSQSSSGGGQGGMGGSSSSMSGAQSRGDTSMGGSSSSDSSRGQGQSNSSSQNDGGSQGGKQGGKLSSNSSSSSSDEASSNASGNNQQGATAQDKSAGQGGASGESRGSDGQSGSSMGAASSERGENDSSQNGQERSSTSDPNRDDDASSQDQLSQQANNGGDAGKALANQQSQDARTPGESTSSNSNSSSESRGSSISKAIGSFFSGLGRLVKWIFVLAIVLVAAFFLWKYRDAVRQLIDELIRLWNALWGVKKPAKANAVVGQANAVAAPPRPVPFATFRNPFSTGAAQKSNPAQLVRYTFEALESWAFEHHSGRKPEDTPLEFAESLAANTAVVEAADVRQLAAFYARMAYAGQMPGNKCLPVLERLWTAMSRTAMVLPPTPVTAGDKSAS